MILKRWWFLFQLLNAAHQAASYMKENVVQLVEKEHKGQVVHGM